MRADEHGYETILEGAAVQAQARIQRGGKALFGMGPEELRAVVEGLGLQKYRAVQLGDALYKRRVDGWRSDDVAGGGAGAAGGGRVCGGAAGDGADGEECGWDGAVSGAAGGWGDRGDGVDAGRRWRRARGWERGGRKRRVRLGMWRMWWNAEFVREGRRRKRRIPRFPPVRDHGERTVGDGYKRATICVSSQVGCAVNCQFCLTAKLGIRRNLTAGEIAGQVAAVLNRQRVRIGSGKGVETPSRINLVFMGMGEPFLNYDAFMQAVHVLRAMGIPESRMTVSTSGILPGILRFAEEPVRPKLALSLNASNDTVRREIMPITRKWDIAALLDAVRAICRLASAST